MSRFFKPSFWKSLHIIFKLLEFHWTYPCFRCVVVVTSLGISKTWAKNIFFDKANVLKIIILPSMVRFLRHQVLKSSQYIWFHTLPHLSFSIVLSRLLCVLISLVLNLKTMKIKKTVFSSTFIEPIFFNKKVASSG